MYNILCQRTCSGYSTPDVHLKGLTLNRVLDIVMDSWFMADLVQSRPESMEFQSYCLNAIDTFHITGEDLSILGKICFMRRATQRENGLLVCSLLNQHYNQNNDIRVKEDLSKLSHKTLISILCMVLEDNATLAECLELAALTPTYDAFGRISGLK